MRRRASVLAFIALASGCGTPPPADAPVVAAPVSQPAPPETGKVCAAAPAAKVGEVARVVLRGAPADLDLCRKIKAKAGAPLDEAIVDGDLHELFATGVLADVVVTVESGSEGDTLVYQASMRPKIAAFALEGGIPTTAERLAEITELQREAPLSRQATLDAETRIEGAYFEAGYRRATVKTELRPAGAGHVDVVFQVAIGPRTQAASVTIEGNTALAAADLAALLHPLEGAPLRESQLDDLRIQLMDRYRETGRVLANLPEPKVTESADGSRADVVFRVVEGPVFKIGKLTFSGVDCPKPTERPRLLGETRTGATARPSVLQATILRLQAACAAKGQPVTVVPGVDLDEKKRTLDIKLEVTASP